MRADEIDWAWRTVQHDFQSAAAGVGYVGNPLSPIDEAFVFLNDTHGTILTLLKTETGFVLKDTGGRTVWRTPRKGSGEGPAKPPVS